MTTPATSPKDGFNSNSLLSVMNTTFWILFSLLCGFFLLWRVSLRMEDKTNLAYKAKQDGEKLDALYARKDFRGHL